MASLDADVNYAGGVFTLDSLKGHMTDPLPGQNPAAGTINGGGKVQVVPLGDLAANLTFDRIPVSAVASLCAGQDGARRDPLRPIRSARLGGQAQEPGRARR